jgi:hypothetical protein
MPNRSRHQTQHEALISGKYEKALSIVQQLTASSGIQPSREQKLQVVYNDGFSPVHGPHPKNRPVTYMNFVTNFMHEYSSYMLVISK